MMKTCSILPAAVSLAVASLIPQSTAFQAVKSSIGFACPSVTAFQAARPSFVARPPTSICLSADEEGAAEEDVTPQKSEKFDTRVMEMFVNQKYKAFAQLLSNKKMWEELQNGDGGYTLFAPNNAAFDALGEEKLRQLNDPRNIETTEKIGAYHAITAPVTSAQLFDSKTGGIKTLGGEVPVGKTKSGGFLGFGGKEDGGVTVNGAKILESFEVTNCIVHEVDGLISPPLLWRYMDQLRIPGT